MSEPQPTFQPNPSQFQPPPPQTQGIPTWAIVLIAVLGGSAVLCVVAGFVVVGVLTVLGNQVSQVFDRVDTQLQEGVPAATSVPVATDGARGIGESAASGGLEFVVQRADAATPSANMPPPRAGNTYLAVQLHVRNTSSNETFLAGFNSRMQNETGDVYQLSLFGQAGAETNLFQSVAPGETTTVTYIYEVPTNARELFWVYEDTGSPPVVVKVR